MNRYESSTTLQNRETEVLDYEKENNFFPVQGNIEINLATNKKILNWTAKKSQNDYQNA